MKHFTWNTDKNIFLKKTRGISFEEILYYIEKDYILDDYIHPNNDKYPDQRILVIEIDNYAYLIPYLESEEEIFLKTIIPSRKATETYLGDKT